MTISFYVKNGTGGYYDYGDSDLLVFETENKTFPIPRVGESIEFLEVNDQGRKNENGELFKEYHEYIVTNVKYWVAPEKFGVSVYTLPVGRSLCR